MSIDKDTVAHIARLARIKTTEQEQQALAGELSNILGWIEQLGEVDTENTEPMTSVVEAVQRMREDAVSDGGYPEDVLFNAPESAHGFYVVPKVVE